MDRRTFLGAAGLALAGCAGSGSRFSGPTEEDPDEIDLRYRSYTDEEVASIKREAGPLPYDAVLAAPESHAGDPVRVEGFVADVLEREDHVVFRIPADGSIERMLHASWTGEALPDGTSVTCWGEVLGVEVFSEGMGREVTEPALALAAIERREA